MNCIEIDKNIMRVMNFSCIESEFTGTCRLISGISFEKSLNLIISNLDSWNSKAILMSFFKRHEVFGHPKFNYPAGFLLLGEMKNHRKMIGELLSKEIILSFYDLERGKYMSLDITQEENENDLYELDIRENI